MSTTQSRRSSARGEAASFHDPQRLKRATKKRAISEAGSRFSPLREIEPGRWAYYVRASADGAWLPALRLESYREARRKRVAGIASLAAYSLLASDLPAGEDDELAWRIIEIAYGPNEGSVEKRVDDILRRLR